MERTVSQEMASESRAVTRRPGRPALSTEDPAARDRILQAARAVFAAVGYHDTTLQQVARVAEVSRPAINHHFAGKAELYEAVFEDVRQRVVAESIAYALATSEHLGARISAFMGYSMNVGADDHTYASFIAASLLDTSRSPELAHLASRHLGDLRTFLRRVCEDGIVSGELPAGTSPAITAEALLAIVWGTGLYVAYLGDSENEALVIDRVARIVHAITAH